MIRVLVPRTQHTSIVSIRTSTGVMLYIHISMYVVLCMYAWFTRILILVRVHKQFVYSTRVVWPNGTKRVVMWL